MPDVTTNSSRDPATAKAQIRALRLKQPNWSATPIRTRLRILRSVRHALVGNVDRLLAAVEPKPGRVAGETVTLELLPLADAARFLECNAARLLAPNRLSRNDRPGWLFGVSAEIWREPCGIVLILGPSNYPLLLPGVQLLQALVAGNGVLLKPAPGTTAPMQILVELLEMAGLPPGLVELLGEETETAQAAIAAGVDKVVLTGSASTGRSVMADLAPTATPAIMELSGNDAVFVLPGADLDLVARALAFGVRLNGGATCIAPRRVFVIGQDSKPLEAKLTSLLASVPPVELSPRIMAQVKRILQEAVRAGGEFSGVLPEGSSMTPAVVVNPAPESGLMREDIFAPVLSLLSVPDAAAALALAALCPFGLGTSIFGPEREAQAIARSVAAGSVSINDLIAPTADPRLPFGGRKASGYGVTRGGEGLLEMTVIKTVSSRSGRFRPHYDPAGPAQARLAQAYLKTAHGSTLTERIAGVIDLIKALMAYRSP